MGSVDELIARGTEQALPAQEKLNQVILDIVVSSESIAEFLFKLEALRNFEAHDLTDFATPTYETCLLADLYGRLELAVEHEGVALADTSWVSLPFRKAIEFFKSKKILSSKTFDKLDAAHKQRAFSVAKLNNKYLLESVHETVQKALVEGMSIGEFRKQVNQTFDSLGVTRLNRFHLDNVFLTNTLGAYSHGRYQQMTTPEMKKTRPYWQYKTAGDGRVRPAHAAMNGLVYAVDDPIWKTWYPPCGFRCRCKVFALSKGEVKDEKLPVETDAPTYKDDKGNKRVAAPDEGWAVSPADYFLELPK